MSERDEGFRKGLASLINCYSRENGSDTPDFILADYLDGCLRVFDGVLQRRETWYGRKSPFPTEVGALASPAAAPASEMRASGPWRCYAGCGRSLEEHRCKFPFEDSSRCDTCQACALGANCSRVAMARLCKCGHSFSDHSNSDNHHGCSKCKCSNPAPPSEPAAPAPEKSWTVKLSCCGRDDGTFSAATWAEADAFREHYLNADGHKRSAIIVSAEPAAPAAETEKK